MAKVMKAGKVENELVIFRQWKIGCEIIALFPEIAADNIGYFCESYMHIGQHSAASPQAVISQTKPATPIEYAVLQDELERVVGYDLKIIKRFRYSHQLERMKQARI